MEANSKEVFEKINAEGIILKGSATFFKSKFNGLPGELYLSSKRLIFARSTMQTYILGAGVAGGVFLFSNTVQEPLLIRLLFLAIVYAVIFSVIKFMKLGKPKVVYSIEMNSIKFFSKESLGPKKNMIIALNDGTTIKFSMDNTEEWEHVIRKLVRLSA